jgi:exonuclease SbcC
LKENKEEVETQVSGYEQNTEMMSNQSEQMNLLATQRQGNRTQLTQKTSEFNQYLDAFNQIKTQEKEFRFKHQEIEVRHNETQKHLHALLTEHHVHLDEIETISQDELTQAQALITHIEHQQKQKMKLEQQTHHYQTEITHLQPQIPQDQTQEVLLDGLNSIQSEITDQQEIHFHSQNQIDLHIKSLEQEKEMEADHKRVKQEYNRWSVIADVIGSSSGKIFRNFAQSLTLEIVLNQANLFLKELAPRYLLMRIEEQDLEFQVIDQDQGDEARSLHSLSGGEAFLISLALALGLSNSASQDIPIQSLFIDEGFGTLDPNSLETALAVLDSLQYTGRQIGVISHVEGLAERVGTEVQVKPLGGGRSQIKVKQKDLFARL